MKNHRFELRIKIRRHDWSTAWVVCTTAMINHAFISFLRTSNLELSLLTMFKYESEEWIISYKLHTMFKYMIFHIIICMDGHFNALCLCWPISWMAAIFRDFVAVMRTLQRTIPLAMITTRKSIHWFPLLSNMGMGLRLAAFRATEAPLQDIPILICAWSDWSKANVLREWFMFSAPLPLYHKEENEEA